MREHLHQVGNRFGSREHRLLYYFGPRIPGYHFDFYVLSAAPVEVIQSALRDCWRIILGRNFDITPVKSTRLRGRPRIRQGGGVGPLQASLQIGPDHIVYVGDS